MDNPAETSCVPEIETHQKLQLDKLQKHVCRFIFSRSSSHTLRQRKLHTIFKYPHAYLHVSTL